MRSIRMFALAMVAALSIGAGKPARPNWNATVAVTPTGSHVLGNPAAKLKLTEYLSYTCNHCAQFDREASDRLRLAYVSIGKLSIEVRHLVRDPIDMTVAMLTNCGPPAKFMLNHTAFLRSQDRWIARANNASEAQQQRWNSGDNISRMRQIATDFGFYAIMQSRGYERIAVDRCLADQAMIRRLAEQTSEAERLGVQGTPSFLLNGELLAGTHDWRTLQPQLRARM
jgi:protein-disulfide isomerase